MNDDTVSRIVSLSRVVALTVAVLGTIVIGTAFGLALGLLFAAGGVLVLVISLLWTSVQSLSGETPLTLDEALGLGAPSAEEERKRAVLRALKDLEYERSVGKISEEDYKELTDRYRAEAKVLLKALDRDHVPGRERAEKLLAKRLKEERLLESSNGSAAPPGAADETKAEAPRPEAAPEPERGTPEPSAASPECRSCGTRNDADAQFCKRCGAALSAEETVS